MAKLNKKYALVIVDLQQDFYAENGALSVAGAKELPIKIEQFILEHKDEISEIIMTLDWHPFNHCSFATCGGEWPQHCVNNTPGAGIADEILFASNIAGVPVSFLYKGTHPDIEQYGAADEIFTQCIREDEKEYAICGVHNKFWQNVLTTETDFAFCGLCGDYCVMETMKNFMKFPEFTVKAIPSLVMSIDGGEKFENFINENNIQTI